MGLTRCYKTEVFYIYVIYNPVIDSFTSEFNKHTMMQDFIKSVSKFLKDIVLFAHQQANTLPPPTELRPRHTTRYCRYVGLR